MSTIKVQNIQHTASSTNAIALASDGTCTANITNNLSNRRLTINGAMTIAQRGVSSTNDGYGSVDRFSTQNTGTDEVPTHAQVDVASGTTPYSLGFRKAAKVTNGNQTSGAGAGDYIKFVHRLEAQDIANSGWNYTSSSSNITLSFWVKSSVAQTFFVRVTAMDSPIYNFPFSYAVSANTWTKVTKTISGNSNLVFNNDNEAGLDIEWTLFRGTDTTGSGATLDTWAAYDSSARTPDNTSTWYTTNDATWEITGVQLEIGSVATDFEFRSYAQELALCQRYLYVLVDQAGDSTQRPVANLQAYTTSYLYGTVDLPVEMRIPPTIVSSSGTNYFVLYAAGGGLYAPQVYSARQSTSVVELQVITSTTNVTVDAPYFMRTNNASAYVQFWAEL